MIKRVKKEENETVVNNNDFLKSLVKTINKDAGSEITYLLEDGSPSDVTKWITTGSSLLDYAISNRRNGGAPISKIIEIVGHYSTGKSLLAQLICAAAQKQGAMVMYEDFEGTIDSTWCKTVGLDVNKNFIYAQPNHLEEGFEMIFTTLRMIDEVEKQGKDPFPFTVIVVDSVAGAPVSADLETENVDPGANMGLKARIISKNITNLRGAAGRKNVLLIFLNQLKEKIGAMGYTDEAKFSTPGGKAIRYFSSASMQISSVGKIKNKDNEIVGIETSVKILKNRFGPGFRVAKFPIFFNRGIDDGMSVLEFLSDGHGIVKANNGPKGSSFHFKGDDKETGLNQQDWLKMFKTDSTFKNRAEDLLEAALVKYPESKEGEEVSIEASTDEV